MENTMRIPVICTRGIIVFPGQDVMIEVGRQKSVNAINSASDEYDGQVFIVCQNDIMVEQPVRENLYSVGTLSKIKVVRRKQGYMRITFTGMKRAKLVNLEDDGSMMMADIELLEDVQGDTTEELALVKKIISEFEKIRKNDNYYVDKTELIQALVKTEPAEITLFTRPRRFGKTLVMSMLASFFDIRRDSRDLFEGLKIAEDQKLCELWMNQWPVIFLSFKDAGGESVRRVCKR